MRMGENGWKTGAEMPVAVAIVCACVSGFRERFAWVLLVQQLATCGHCTQSCGECSWAPATMQRPNTWNGASTFGIARTIQPQTQLQLQRHPKESHRQHPSPKCDSQVPSALAFPVSQVAIARFWGLFCGSRDVSLEGWDSRYIGYWAQSPSTRNEK